MNLGWEKDSLYISSQLKLLRTRMKCFSPQEQNHFIRVIFLIKKSKNLLLVRLSRTGCVDNPSQSTRCDNSRNKNRVDNTSLSFFLTLRMWATIIGLFFTHFQVKFLRNLTSEIIICFPNT
jgi:hypothetical protein